ncbi:MAG: pantoate--beta-alanine ligase [Chitinophagaceae bacterium]|nr:pantoate--beta-alanine ligase [Chitinophagaceae bacterium]
MIIFKKTEDLRSYLAGKKAKNAQVGFIPTMGALHAGHLSLVEKSRKDSSITVCSIFVNPTQFNDPKDFEKYPSTIEGDITQLEAVGCEALFLPSTREIYGDDTGTEPHFEIGYLEHILEGKYRPGHFQGVCQVMSLLLDIVQPDRLYLGQKDYQQCMVIDRLVELLGMRETRVMIAPTLREADGLAMSSRNIRLNKEERAKAPAIYESLLYIKEHLEKGETSSVENQARTKLDQRGFRTDYIEIADAETLQSVEVWDGKRKLVIVAASFLGEVRLIDNLIV